MYTTFLSLHQSCFCRDWNRDENLARKGAKVVETLSGWGNLGRRLATDCAGAKRFTQGLWMTVLGLTASLATTFAVRLLPWNLSALSAASALVLLTLTFAVWWHIRSMPQTLHPYHHSPCEGIPNSQLKIKDSSFPIDSRE